jgi:hypothetical protein
MVMIVIWDLFIAMDDMISGLQAPTRKNAHRFIGINHQ